MPCFYEIVGSDLSLLLICNSVLCHLTLLKSAFIDAPFIRLYTFVCSLISSWQFYAGLVVLTLNSPLPDAGPVSFVCRAKDVMFKRSHPE